MPKVLAPAAWLGWRIMAGADKTAAALLDKLAALDLAQRREVAEGLRKLRDRRRRALILHLLQ